MKKILLAALFSFHTVLLCAQADTLARIDALFAHWNNATPGGSIAIQRGDKIIYRKAFGLSDLEHNVPNTTETVFESGSVAKQFTATAILLLAAEGKINLQDDVRKYIPELPVYKAPVTIQHLLNHTSGLKDWGAIGSLAGWPRTTRVYTQDLALHIMSRQRSLNFEPGAQYSYSNANYSLLVTIVERVSKKSLAHFTDSVFFKPLGMRSTQWRDNFREVVPDRAIAYSKRDNQYQQLMPFEHVHGHGGLLTTTGDLLKWNTLLETKTIGNQVATWRIQKGRLNTGEEIAYAGGLFIGDVNGYLEIGHSGATAGYRAWLAYYPQKKLSVVALSNDASFSGAPQQIAEIFLGKSETKSFAVPTKFITLSEEEKKSWTGVFKSLVDNEVIRLEYRDKKMISNGNEVSALHRDTLYFDRFYWIRTSPTEIILKTPAQTRNYKRVAAPDTSKESLQQWVGTYYSDDAEATYRVSVIKNELFFQILPWPAQKLTPAFLNGFHDSDLTVYEFRKDKKGTSGLDVSTGRALRVPFEKIK